MPDFIVALLASIVFCLGVVVFNALTELAVRLKVAPTHLSENGLLQYGLALVVAYVVWQRAIRRDVA